MDRRRKTEEVNWWIRELEIRLSGEQETRWQVIRTAGYQVKEQKTAGREMLWK